MAAITEWSSAITPLSALIAGVVTSVHCTGMCGPLACAAFGRSRSPWTPLTYHLGRLVSYSFAGGFLGMAGQRAAALFSSTPAKLLPWAFALLFIVFAFGLEKRIPQPKAFGKLLFRFRLASLKRGTVAAVLGLVTPLLPCGPLYLALGVTVFSGSFAAGTLLMASFAVGTVPLPFLIHTQFARLPISAIALQYTRRGLALVSAVLLVWRAMSQTGGLLAPMACPLCH